MCWLPQEDRGLCPPHVLSALGALGASLHVEEVEAQALGSPSLGGILAQLQRHHGAKQA